MDQNGRPVGVANEDPMLDTRRYNVKYINGSSEVIAANIIAENILSDIEEEGNSQMLLDDVIDHRINENGIPKFQG